MLDKDEAEQIRQAIRAIVKNMIPPAGATWGIVKSVDGQSVTVTFDDGTGEIDVKGILLGFDKSGVIVFPKVNSRVMVVFTDKTKNRGAVVLVQETDKIEIMGSNFGGLGLTEKIAERIKRLEDNVNSLKGSFNNHLTTYAAHTHAGVTSGMASTAPAGPDAGNESTIDFNPSTDQDYISSTKVKHGDAS